MGDDTDERAPGEKLFRVLELFYERWHMGRGQTSPHEVDIEALARSLGLWSEVEYVQDNDEEAEQYLHFQSQVLVIDHQQEFPWQLLSIDEWVRDLEMKDFWRFRH